VHVRCPYWIFLWLLMQGTGCGVRLWWMCGVFVACISCGFCLVIEVCLVFLWCAVLRGMCYVCVLYFGGLLVFVFDDFVCFAYFFLMCCWRVCVNVFFMCVRSVCV